MISSVPPRAPTDFWNSRDYATHARFVSDYGATLIDMLAPCRGEIILDLGCGDGVLTKKLIDTGATMIAIDAAADMVARARVIGVEAQQCDVRDLADWQRFDAVFSNAVLHWLGNRDQAQLALQRIFAALKPAGRFVGEFGGAGNIASIIDALDAYARYAAEHRIPTGTPMQWYFPNTTDFTALLQKTGFEVDEMMLYPRPTPLPTTIQGWLETMCRPFLDTGDKVDPDAPCNPDALAFLQDYLKPSLYDPYGEWVVDYVRLRFRAHVPASA